MNFSLKRKFTFILIILFFTNLNLTFAQTATTNTTPEPYGKTEFLSWTKELRRAEIIALGSLPFITIGVNLGYGGYQYFMGNIDSFPNPLDKSKNPFDEDQQKQIFAISLGVSCAIGLTDFIINISKHSIEKKRLLKKQAENKIINATPYVPPVDDEEYDEENAEHIPFEKKEEAEEN